MTFYTVYIKFRSTNDSSNKIVFAQEPSLNLDKWKQSTNSWICYLYPAVVIIDMPLIFYDVQATFYEKVKFWSATGIINVFIWHP